MLCFFCPVVITVALALLGRADLRSDLTGKGFRVLFPGDPGYSNESIPYNLRYDSQFRPAAITFPSTVAQVAQIVKAGYRNDYRVAARSGGHSYIADGLGGRTGSVVVDMRRLNTITVNSDTTATIGSGSRLGDVDLALNSRGRALPHGTCPYVGMGGHTGYGGFGFASRMWGLTIDNILSIEVVLANGTVVSTSRFVRPNLFWALRGAAPSFGITTSTQVRTHPVPLSVTAFTYGWEMPPAEVARAIENFQSFSQTNLPSRLGAQMLLFRGNRDGTVIFYFKGAWYGPTNQFPGVIQPYLNTLPRGFLANTTTGSYRRTAEILGLTDTLNTTVRPENDDYFYARSVMVPQSAPMSTQSLQALAQYLASTGYSLSGWFMQIELWGGQNSVINTVQTDATAFAHRNKLFTIQLYVSVSDHRIQPFPTRDFSFLDTIESMLQRDNADRWRNNPGAYLNYMEDGGRYRNSNTDLLRARFYAHAYTQLSKLKIVYDPTDVFRFPVGVENPTGGGNNADLEIHPNGNLRKCIDVQGNSGDFGDGTPVQMHVLFSAFKLDIWC
ncbi:hypothetical protein BDQ17DRAFT_1433750 [Cyathus striatus]|nr:hypothetical protein BDQ17DRAFT_1433750 [Cyathus striatus]